MKKSSWIKSCLMRFGVGMGGILVIQTGALIWFLSRVNTVLAQHDEQIEKNNVMIIKNNELIHKLDKEFCP